MDEIIGNQQATQGEIGWLAGMLEGDGSCNLRMGRVGKVTSKHYVVTAVEFMNTDKAIIEHVVSVASKLGVSLHVKHNIPMPEKYRRKMMYQARTHRMKQAEPLLKALLPYMVGEKAERARLMLAFIDERKKSLEGKHSGWHTTIPYTEREMSLIARCQLLVSPWKSSESIRTELQLRQQS